MLKSKSGTACNIMSAAKCLPFYACITIRVSHTNTRTRTHVRLAMKNDCEACKKLYTPFSDDC